MGGAVEAGPRDVVPGDARPAAPRHAAARRRARARRAAEAHVLEDRRRGPRLDRPKLMPATPGRWTLLDAHTLAFRPAGLGFALGSSPSVALPRAVHVVGRSDGTLTRTLAWEVPTGSTLRLQQLLAQLGYLPRRLAAGRGRLVDRRSGRSSRPRSRRRRAASSWRYPNTPAELTRSGRPASGTRSPAAR